MTVSNRRFRALPAVALAALIALVAACSSEARSEPMTVEAPPAAAGTGPTQATAEPPSPASSPALPTSVAQAAAEPDADRAYEHLRRLASDLGDRVSGTDDERQAADYIAGVLRGYGYDVEMQRFPVSAFISRRVSLEMESPQRQTFKAQPLTNSQPGEVSGEVVYAGVGRDSDFTEAVRGRIALVQRDGQITHQQKAMAAAAAGAKALVIFNNSDDLFLGELSQNAPPPIPVLSISGAEGRALRDRIQAGTVQASLLFEGGRETRDSVNVVARPPGARCQTLLGGHYDSVANAPGASDNASGTAAVIEMARIQALRGNPEQACFAAFGSEETGLDGSRAFVRSMSAEEKNALRFMLNFDMVAVGTEWLLIGSPELQEQGKAILNSMGLNGRATTLLGASSDHASFINGGIPALFLHRSDDPLLHTPQDAIDRIDKQALGESMRIGLALLAGINPT
jgi:aminopeptidase YwaD